MRDAYLLTILGSVTLANLFRFTGVLNTKIIQSEDHLVGMRAQAKFAERGTGVCAYWERTLRAVARLGEDSVLASESSHGIAHLMSRKAPIGANQNLRGELRPSIDRFTAKALHSL